LCLYYSTVRFACKLREKRVRLLKVVFSDVLTNSADDMQFFNDCVDDTVIETLQHIIASPFVRLAYSEAIEILRRSGQDFEFPVSWGMDLQAEHERYLTEHEFKRPVILTDYPASIKAFYMQPDPNDPDVVLGLDMIAPEGYGEINLNVGCPSDRVQSGRFGACLMREPELVAECMAAIGAAVKVPATVKCQRAPKATSVR